MEKDIQAYKGVFLKILFSGMKLNFSKKKASNDMYKAKLGKS
jgi:hypothetical protein